MDETDITGDLNRLVGNSVVGMGVVPEHGVALIFFSGEITLYIKTEKGELKLEVDAPSLQ